MRKSSLERLRDAKREKFQRTELSSFDELVALLVDGTRPQGERHVNPTQLKFIKSPARIKAYKGPAGCAKTSTGVADIFSHALLEPGTKYLIARADYNDLMDTTMLRAQEMLEYLPEGTLIDRNKSSPEKWYLRPAAVMGADGELDETPSQITFMGLKDTLGSYEFSGAFLDEADEMDEKRVHEVNTRLRWKKGHKFIGLAFNPPDVNHWLYTACTGKDAQGEEVRPAWMTLFEPNPKENTRNLPDDYYDLLAGALPEDMRQRLVDGVWGSTFPGEAVVREYSRMLHNSMRLEFRGGTLFRFWDFGYNRPACLFVQVSKAGHIEVLREYLGHHIEGSKFIELVRQRTQEWFPSAHTFIDYGDPAVAQKKDTGQMLKLLFDAGVTMRYQHTPFDVSMAVLRKKFESLIEKTPAVRVDARLCPILSGGLAGGYHFKRDGITPFKDGYYDHLVDALRYGLFNIFGVNDTSSTTKQSYAIRGIAYWENQT